MSKLDQRREEFFRYVWDHTADPFVIGYEARAPLTDEELQWLQQVYQYCQADVEIATPSLKELLVNNGASLTTLTASDERLDTQQNHQRPESESWKGLRAK
jgi:Ser/Thr protein kinase RdoA (MazF antagonist)